MYSPDPYYAYYIFVESHTNCTISLGL